MRFQASYWLVCSKFGLSENFKKTDDTPYFPSKHLQYHLHPKWMQEYPRQGPLRDVKNNGEQLKLQNYCKQLDVAINQKWYLKNLLEDENKVCIFFIDQLLVNINQLLVTDRYPRKKKHVTISRVKRSSLFQSGHMHRTDIIPTVMANG